MLASYYLRAGMLAGCNEGASYLLVVTRERDAPTTNNLPLEINQTEYYYFTILILMGDSNFIPLELILSSLFLRVLCALCGFFLIRS